MIYYNPAYKRKPSHVNYALVIVSKVKYDPDDGNMYKWCINLDIPHSIQIEKISGKAVEEYVPYAQSIMNFILHAYKINLKFVVADFIKDIKGDIWFIDLKSFRVPKALYPLYIQARSKTKSKMKMKDNMKSYANCRLCNLEHSKRELQHLVTMNMIMEYKRHLNQRGIFEFEHVDVTFQL